MPKHFRHVGIVVSNLDAAIDAFRKLGFEETKRHEKVDSEQVRKIIGIPNATLRIAIMRDSENVAIELMEYLCPCTELQSPRVNGTGVSHVALRVDDINALYTSREAFGLSFLSYPVINVCETAIVAYVLVLEEILIELVQVLSPVADYS